MTDPQTTVRLGERISIALPAAISEAFGGETEVTGAGPGELAALVAAVPGAHHLHLELEAGTGRQEGQRLLFVLPAQPAEALFELEQTDPDMLADPSTQLRLLGEFTEGAEALAESLTGALAAAGIVVTLRVSGASLEESADSPGAAGTPFGEAEAVACTMMLQRSGGSRFTIVVGASRELAATLAGGAAADGGIQERAATLAARDAERLVAAPPVALAPPTPLYAPAAAAPPPTPITAHPFAFGQLDVAPSSARADHSVDLILDVALHVRVELGSTRMTVEEVLALGPGSVVELERLAGEPVDVVVNDRLIARGEVVVVEENFGVRITEIVFARNRSTAAV